MRAKHQLHDHVLPKAAGQVQPASEDDVVHLHCIHKVHPHLLITIWYAAANAKRNIRSAERMIGCNPPSPQDLYAYRTLRHEDNNEAEPSHLGELEHCSAHTLTSTHILLSSLDFLYSILFAHLQILLTPDTTSE